VSGAMQSVERPPLASKWTRGAHWALTGPCPPLCSVGNMNQRKKPGGLNMSAIRGRRTPAAKRTCVTLLVPLGMLEELDQRAAADERSRSDWIRRAIRRAIEAQRNFAAPGQQAKA
jgi:hypothetical protein